MWPRRRSPEWVFDGLVDVGLDDGREVTRADEGRVVSYVAFVQPLVSVERCVDSARRREVERPLRKEEAD